jgi:hypothetical protein
VDVVWWGGETRSRQKDEGRKKREEDGIVGAERWLGGSSHQLTNTGRKEMSRTKRLRMLLLWLNNYDHVEF